MAQPIYGPEYAVTVLNRGFENKAPGHALFNNQVKTAGTTTDSQYAFAAAVGKGYVNVSDADLAKQVLTNLGVLPSTEQAILDLETALADFFGTVSKEDRGIVVLQLGEILSSLDNATGDLAVYAPAAAKWNVEVRRSFEYSNDEDNTLDRVGDFDTEAVTLTRETDVATSSVFNGYLDYNKFTGKDEATLTSSDRLTGTDGDNDVLFAQVHAAQNNQRPTLTGIEIISIDAKSGAVSIDLSDTKGAKTLVNKGSHEDAALTFNNVGNVVDVVVENTKSNTAVNFTASVFAGKEDNLNVTLNGAGSKIDPSLLTLTPAAGVIESLTINASGAASVLSGVDSAGVKSVTITGDQALTIGSKTAGGFSSNAIETVDASAATGNLVLNLAASAGKDQTITLGSGNDVVVTGNLNAKDTITGGDGVDRVVLTTASTNEAVKLVGVEQIEARAAGTNINLINAPDVTLIAVAEVAGPASLANVTSAKSGLTFAFEGEGDKAAVSGDNAVFGAVKFALANASGKSDVINFTFSNAGVEMVKDATVTIGALTGSNNVETLNFTFSDLVASNAVTIADIAGPTTSLTTLNYTSASKVVANGLDDLKALTKVDATGVDGGFVTDGNGFIVGKSADSSILLGGAGKNNVKVTHEDDTKNDASKTVTLDGSAGTGVQTLTLINNDQNTNLAAANGYNGVVRGGSGGDTITVESVANAQTLVAAGAGIDNITLTNSVGKDFLELNLGDTGATVATADTVVGFNTALDLIDLRSFGFDNTLRDVTAAGALLDGSAGQFGGKAVAVATGAGGVVVYVDTNSDNRLSDGDLVVVLTGAAGGSITNADVIWE